MKKNLLLILSLFLLLTLPLFVFDFHAKADDCDPVDASCDPCQNSFPPDYCSDGGDCDPNTDPFCDPCSVANPPESCFVCQGPNPPESCDVCPDDEGVQTSVDQCSCNPETDETQCKIFYCADSEALNSSDAVLCSKNNESLIEKGYECYGKLEAPTCTYGEVKYCDDDSASNYMSAQDCQESNPKKTCVADAGVCVSDLQICNWSSGINIFCSSGKNYLSTIEGVYFYDQKVDECAAPNPIPPESILLFQIAYCSNLVPPDVECTTPDCTEIDWCPFLEGVQTDPAECPDFCPNIDGTQQSYPGVGYPDENGNCDVCDNIPGVQINPEDCDVCPNIAGVQTDPNDCDVCPNIAGVQTDPNDCDVCPFDDGIQYSTEECTNECTEPPCYLEDGVCGSADGATVDPVSGGSFVPDACQPNSVSVIGSPTYPSMFQTQAGDLMYRWNCLGRNDGSDAICEAFVTGCPDGTYFCDITGTCIPNDESCIVDVCPNIEGVQTDLSECCTDDACSRVTLEKLDVTKVINPGGSCTIRWNLGGNNFNNVDENTQCQLRNQDSILFTFNPFNTPTYSYTEQNIKKDKEYEFSCWQNTDKAATLQSVKNICRVNVILKEFN